MAESIQMSRSTFSRAERSLEEAGIIARVTPSNGFRGRTSSRGVKAGLSLAPLIMMIPHLETERQIHLSKLRELNSLRMEIRILRRSILSNPSDQEINTLLAEFPRPSLIRCPDVARTYLEKLKKINPKFPETTDHCVNDQQAEMTDACVKNAPPHKEPIKDSITLEHRPTSTPKRQQHTPAAFTKNDEQRIESYKRVQRDQKETTLDDFTMYLQEADQHPIPLGSSALEIAARAYTTALNISPQFWSRCIAILGLKSAIAAIAQYSKSIRDSAPIEPDPRRFLDELVSAGRNTQSKGQITARTAKPNRRPNYYEQSFMPLNHGF